MGFSRGGSGGLVFQSLSEFSSLLWSTQSKALAWSIKQKYFDLRRANTFKDHLEMWLLGYGLCSCSAFQGKVKLSPQMVILICTSIGKWSFVGLLLPTLVSNISQTSEFLPVCVGKMASDRHSGMWLPYYIGTFLHMFLWPFVSPLLWHGLPW